MFNVYPSELKKSVYVTVFTGVWDKPPKSIYALMLKWSLKFSDLNEKLKQSVSRKIFQYWFY
jgi:hypothetical protein